MLKRTLGIIVALASLGAQCVSADTCIAENQRCLETQTIIVDGFELQNVCINIERTEDCTRSEPINECGALAPLSVLTSPLTDGQCELVSEACLRSVAGVCDKNERIYNCWNGPTIAPPASLEDRSYQNLEENIIDNCAALETDANCGLLETVVTEGFATRNINGQDVTRAWWAQERQYDCTNNLFEDDCQPFDDAPFCQPTGDETCLNYAADGSCEYTEREFSCESNTDFTTSCEAINTCVGENCLNIEPEISEDYPVAAAWLTFLDDAAKSNQCDSSTLVEPTGVPVVTVVTLPLIYTETTSVYPDGTTIVVTEYADGTVETTRSGGPSDSDAGSPISEDEITVSDCDTGFLEGGASEPEVFTGEPMSCFMDTFANCCSNPSNSYCGPEPLDLKYRIDAGAAHELGTRCTSRFLGICLSWSRDYCTYKSKFAIAV